MEEPEYRLRPHGTSPVVSYALLLGFFDIKIFMLISRQEGGEMIVNHTCKCGSWKVTLIGDRSNSQYYVCADCGLLLESLDPKEQARLLTAVADLEARTREHEASTQIVHKKK